MTGDGTDLMDSFKVDGIWYHHPYGENVGERPWDSIHVRPMIELDEELHVARSRMRWDWPPTEAELNRYVRDGVLPLALTRTAGG